MQKYRSGPLPVLVGTPVLRTSVGQMAGTKKSNWISFLAFLSGLAQTPEAFSTVHWTRN